MRNNGEHNPTRVLIALPGLHRVARGAEAALESIGRHLALRDDFTVTMVGSGLPRDDDPYQFVHAGCVPRERFERWPRVPALRNEYAWEELTFIPGLIRAYNPVDFDVTIGCSYPFANWALRARRTAPQRPACIYITENGDWPAQQNGREYRFFHCDGLVCTNPEYFARNSQRWPCTLIPNGVNPRTFAPAPGSGDRQQFGLRGDGPVVLMVSALIESKFVQDGLRAAAAIPESQVIIAGDGPLRQQVDEKGHQLFPGGRYRRLTLPRERMPELYRSADVLLHMSRNESFGNIYIEALSCGLPVVAHDCELTRWMMEDCGELADTTDIAAVSAALHRALQNDSPEQAARRRRLVETRFDWDVVVGQYASFIQDVLYARKLNA